MGLMKTTSLELGAINVLRSMDHESVMMTGKKVLYLGFDGKELGLSARFWQQDVTIHAFRKSDFDGCDLDLSMITKQTRVVHKEIDAEWVRGVGADVIIWWGMRTFDDFKVLESIKHCFNSFVIVGFDASFADAAPSWLSVGTFITKAIGVSDKGSLILPKGLRKKRKPVVKPVEVVETKVEEKKAEKSLTAQDVVVGELKLDVTSLPTSIKSNSSETQEVAKPQKKRRGRPKKKKEEPVVEVAPEPVVEDPVVEDVVVFNREDRVSSMTEKELIDVVFMVSGKIVDSESEAREIISGLSDEELQLVL